MLKISVIYTERQWSMMIKNFNPQINSERLKPESICQRQTLQFQEVQKGCWIFSLTLTSIFDDRRQSKRNSAFYKKVFATINEDGLNLKCS